MKAAISRDALLIALGYFVVGAGWILFSDGLFELLWLESPPMWANVLKGIGFILATAILLGALLHHRFSLVRNLQEKAEETAMRYRAIVEEASEGIVIFDDKGRFLDVNPQFCALMGYSAEELRSRRLDSIIGQTEAPMPFDALQRGEVIRRDQTLLRKDGDIIHVEVSAQQMRAGRYLGFVRDVTERTQLAAQRDEALARLRAVVRASPLAIFTLDPEGRVSGLWNKAAERIFGWTAEEVVGAPLPIVPPEAEAEFKALLDRILEGKWLTGVRLVRRRRDGSPVHVSLSAAPLKNGDNGGSGPTGAIALLEDITEKVVQEEEHRRVREALRRLMANTPNAVTVVNKDLTLFQANSAWERLTGVSAEEAAGKPLTEIFPHRAAELTQKYEDVIRFATPSVCEEMSLTEGAARHFRVVRFPMFDSEGRVEAVGGEAVDITDLKRTRERLEASEARYRLLFAHNPLPMYIMDESTHRFLEANEAAVAHYGYAPKEWLAMTWADLCVDEEAPPPPPGGGPEAGAEETAVCVHKGRDGAAMHMEVAGYRFTHKGRDARLILAKDITARVQAEEAVRQLNEQLESRVRERTALLEETNQELESFSYSVSHDLRAPLRAIDGFAAIIEEDYGAALDAEAQRLFRMIRDSAAKMDGLIGQLLDFSRCARKELRVDSVDMTALARSAMESALQRHGRNPDVCELHPLPPGRGDATLLEQVLYNLVDNALKFTRDTPEPRIVIEAFDRDNEAVYCVRDNGAGFDPAYADKLFAVFQRLHSADEYEGTGVGLATVSRIVRRHGGRVWAEGEPGKGAAFYFTLGGGEA